MVKIRGGFARPARRREQRVALAGDGIVLLFVGEREQAADRVHRVERGLAEAAVELAAPGPRHVRDHRVQHEAAGLVLVETQVEQVAQEAAALRDAEHVRALDGLRARIPLGGGAPAQEARGVPHRGEAEADQRRILRAVVAIVDPAGLEAAVERDRPRVGEAPGRARHRGGGRVAVLAHVQLRLRVVDAGHRVRDVVAVGQRQHVHAGVRPELAAHPLGDAGRPGHRHRHHAVAARHVGLPADPGHRVAVAHQEPVAEVLPGGRIVRARAALLNMPSAILRPRFGTSRSSRRRAAVERPQEIEVGRVLDEPARVAGRQPQVRDRLVLPGRRIRGEVQDPVDLLVARGRRHRLAPGDIEPDDSHRVSLRSRSRGTA